MSPTQQLAAAIPSALPALRARACKILGNVLDAEDAVQDALLLAHQNFHRFRGQAQISTWLSAIVKNAALTQISKRRGFYFSIDEAQGDNDLLVHELRDTRLTPEQEYEQKERDALARRSLTRLSPILRETLELRYVDDLSLNEIAAELAVPVGTVKARLSRARTRLAECIAPALI